MHYEYTDNLSEEEFEEELGEMAHLVQRKSGLPYRFMIDYLGKERKRENNSPRIMISVKDNYKLVVPVSIDKDNPEILISLKEEDIPEFELVKKFIINHYEILMKYWNQEIDDLDTLSLLKESK